MHSVYVAQAMPNGIVKIGKSITPFKRIAYLASSTGLRLTLVRLYEFEKASDCSLVEKYFHELYAKHRHPFGNSIEWFTAEVAAMVPETICPEKADMWLFRNVSRYTHRFKLVWSEKQRKKIRVEIGGYGFYK